MELNIHIILDELKGFSPAHNLAEKQVADNVGMIERKQLLIKPCDHMEKSVLYIAEEKLFLRLSAKTVEGGSFILIGNRFFADSAGRGASVICVDARYTAAELSNCLDEVFWKYEKWDRELTRYIFDRADMNVFLDACIPFLPNPFFILDSMYTLIYIGGEIPEDTSDTILQYVLPSSYFDYESVEISRVNYGGEKYRNTRYAYWAKSDTTDYPFVTYNLFLNHIRYGEIAMLDTAVPLTTGQLYLIDYVGKKLTVLLENIQYKLYAYSSDNYVLLELLEGKGITAKRLELYLKKRGWKQYDTYYVFCFCGVKGEGQEDSYLRMAIPRIKKVIPYSVMVFVDEKLVCLVRDNQNLQVNDTLKKVLIQYLRKLDIQCGISVPFYDFADAKLYYEQSVMALSVGMENRSIDKVVCFEDAYFDCMFHKVSESANLNALYDPRISMLLDYEKEKNVNLFDTLFHYLVNNKSLYKAAEKLSIHKNTVLQRLERIEHISGIRMDGTDHEEYLLFSCRVVRYLMGQKDMFS